mmetsp:Transcript_7505/g.21415  ORF Transcript_7505/g.21415 Transcript_7505/m.21415 type:complete len:234 (+) Transcript_7505:1716-2417(+)
MSRPLDHLGGHLVAEAREVGAALLQQLLHLLPIVPAAPPSERPQQLGALLGRVARGLGNYVADSELLEVGARTIRAPHVRRVWQRGPVPGLQALDRQSEVVEPQGQGPRFGRRPPGQPAHDSEGLGPRRLLHVRLALGLHLQHRLVQFVLPLGQQLRGARGSRHGGDRGGRLPVQAPDPLHVVPADARALVFRGRAELLVEELQGLLELAQYAVALFLAVPSAAAVEEAPEEA